MPDNKEGNGTTDYLARKIIDKINLTGKKQIDFRKLYPLKYQFNYSAIPLFP